MASKTANHFRYLLATKSIDFANDTFIMILMQSGFSFDEVNHKYYTDVSSSELADGYGYTKKSKVLVGVSVTESSANKRAEVTWNDASWTATGGSLTASGAIIIDDTEANDSIIGYIDFGGNQTVPDAGTFTVANILVTIS